MGPPGFSIKTTKKGNMKRMIGYSSGVALAVLVAGCVGPMGPVGGVGGMIYTDVSGPVLATSHTGSSKMGEATSRGILGFAKGDSSIKTAAANAGITKIHNVDYHITGFLGLWAKTTVIVYGE
jgi:hypothetical protein